MRGRGARRAYLVQLPVELRGPEGVGLVEVLPQEEHQAAVVHVQGVVMPVHFWKQKADLGVRDAPTQCQSRQSVFLLHHLAHLKAHWHSSFSFAIASEECSRTHMVELTECKRTIQESPQPNFCDGAVWALNTNLTCAQILGQTPDEIYVG